MIRGKIKHPSVKAPPTKQIKDPKTLKELKTLVTLMAMDAEFRIRRLETLIVFLFEYVKKEGREMGTWPDYHTVIKPHLDEIKDYIEEGE